MLLFFRVCRPQNIMVCSGKRCKANYTFSAEKYTWFTVWKLTPPPQPFHVSLTTIKTKQNKKRPIFFTTSDIWQLQNDSALSVSTLSEHFHTYWDVFTLAICCCAHAHCKKQAWQRQLCQQGSSFSRYEISGGQCQIPRKWHPKQWDYPHVLCVFSPQGQECPSNVCTQSLRACHIYIQSVSLWCVVAKSPFRRSLHHPSFFLFFSFLFAVMLQ